MKILIIEDEPSLRELMCRELTREHYVVESAATFFEADAKLAGYRYDCVLLDIMLPDGNGLRLLEMLKAAGRNENVIVISARDSLEDKVLGLELGADDYLPKPFHLMELSARIRSVARRQRGGRREVVLGNVSLDPEGQRVTVGGEPLHLLKKEFRILAYFMQRPNHLIDKTMLAESVWGDHVDQLDSFHFVYGQIKNLRRKLQEAGADIEIQAVYGFGYKLVAPAAEPA
ncbi:MAG: response regulator transcription factor [Alistipes sp.]|nr:response regulator transcription factor [Alistipes sp.]